MFGSRQKGRVGEREVAKLLARWWTQIEPGCQFVPTPGSGGFARADIRAAMQISGDLCTTAKKFPFVIEVKRREGWNLERVQAGKPSPVWGWWDQCKRAAAEMNGKPLLIFRKNREPWHYIMGALPGIGMEVRVEATSEVVYFDALTELLSLDPVQWL